MEDFTQKINIKNRQREVDRLFEKEGLTDRVLEKQVTVNKLRNRLNYPDENEKVYRSFVQ